jgi:hypothetical protein
VRSTLAVEVEADSLVRTGADLAVAGFFRDQRPLRGGAGVADWRLCGWLSALLETHRLRGDWGEAALLTTHGRLGAPRLLLLGLGLRARFGPDAHREAVREAVARLLDLGAGTAALDIPPPAGAETLERLAEGVLGGACQVLDVRPGRLLLRVVALPGYAARVRGALAHVAASLPRGATSIKMMRPPLPPSGASGARPPGPGTRPEAPPG